LVNVVVGLAIRFVRRIYSSQERGTLDGTARPIDGRRLCVIDERSHNVRGRSAEHAQDEVMGGSTRRGSEGEAGREEWDSRCVRQADSGEGISRGDTLDATLSEVTKINPNR
jgi:hypothetical protein